MNWNRQTVREFNRKHKTNYTKEQLEMLEVAMQFRAGNLNVESMKDLALNPFINIKLDTPIPQGTEVKLNYDILLNRKIKMSQKYVEFVQTHKDEILHTTDENAKEGYVCLVEDPEKIWLWSPLFDLLYRNEAGEFVEYSDSVLAPKQSEEELEEKKTEIKEEKSEKSEENA